MPYLMQPCKELPSISIDFNFIPLNMLASQGLACDGG